MLTEQELTKLFESRGIPANGREMIRAIRRADPSRRVVAGAGNVTTRYPSRKMGWTVQAESHTGELPAVYIWDHDTVTHEVYDQAPRIKLNYTDRNGKNRGHTTRPDFFLIQDDFVGWVECKDEKWLQARKAENSPLFIQAADGSWSCPAGIAFASALGLGFKVRSSLENPPALDRNLEFLTDYWDMPAPLPRYEESLAKLKSLFEEKAWHCLADLLGPDHMLDADAVNWAITRERVFVDLFTQPIAEAHNVTVFRSEVHAKAFHLQAESVQHPSERIDLSSLPIDMRPGARIAWDDALFTIKTVTPLTAYLEDTTGNLVTLTNDQLLQLTKKGAIKGVLSTREAVCSRADEIIFSAAPSDLDDGIARHDLLQRMACTSGAAAIAVTDRTVRNWRRRARDSEEIHGNAFIGLISRTSLRGNRSRKMDEAVISKMTEIINTDYASFGATLSKTLCYGKLLNACETENLVAPSEKTFRKTVKSLISIEKETYARQGERAAYKHSPFIHTLHYSTPRHGDRPFEIGHIDHTQLDLQLVGRKWGESLGKAWLTLMFDATTRSVLAFVITFDAPSYRSCMLVIRDCIKRHGRLPSTIVADQGSDFESKYFETLLARFSVAKKSRPRQKPRFGAVIERFFGITNTEFIHNLTGNNKPLQDAREMSPTHDPRLNAIWDLKTFTGKFERFAFEIYGNNEHSALGVSPNQAMRIGLARTGMRDSRIIPWTVGTYILTLPSTPKGTAMVVPGRGVKIMHLYYFHPLMRESRFHGGTIPVRYDPFDRASAYVYLSNEWRPCVSEMANFFRGRSEREIEFASSELNERQSRNGRRRDINAQSLAAFIQEAECEETVLRQRQRDLEYRAATEQSDEPLAAHCANDPETEFDHTQNPWVTEHVFSFEVCK